MRFSLKSALKMAGLVCVFLSAPLILGMPPGSSFAGDKPPSLSREIRFADQNFQTAVRALQADTRAQLLMVPRIVTPGGFESTVESVGDIVYMGLGEHYQLRENLLSDLRGIVNSIGANESDANDLRGLGGKMDDYLEDRLWMEPSAFGKYMEDRVRQVRLSVEILEVSQNKLIELGVDWTAQINPGIQDAQIFTQPVVEPEQRVPWIGAIIGGTYRTPTMSDANSYACAFGFAKANTMLDLNVTGMGGPYNLSGSVDNEGEWKICLGLKQGYYRFEANDGENVDVREVGFLFNSKVKF